MTKPQPIDSQLLRVDWSALANMAIEVMEILLHGRQSVIRSYQNRFRKIHDDVHIPAN